MTSVTQSPAAPPASPVAPRSDRHPKPRLRGWLHAAAAPLIAAACIILLVHADTAGAKAALAVYLATSLLLFGTSAAYHIGHWTPRVVAALRRADHTNIYLFIAGTYTPISVLLLTGTSRVVLLTLIWVACAAGVLFRLVWMGAPRWLYVGLYVVIGFTALGWVPQFWAVGPIMVWLLLAGGVAYTLGAVVYARRRPNPIPAWFGFHEVFHSATVIAAACHFGAIAWAVYR